MSRPRIMVVSGGAYSSRAIELVGGGTWSHMANLLADGSVWDARDDVVKFGGVTYGKGVQHRPAGYLEAENKKWAIFEAPSWSEAVYDEWVALLATQRRKPYDQHAIEDFVPGLLYGEFKDQNYAEDQSLAWFCDEYCIWGSGRLSLVPWPLPLKIYAQTPGSALNIFIGAKWSLVSSYGVSEC
jgi:hypothetical protein